MMSDASERLTALVVDDDQLMRLMLREALSSIGLDVAEAVDGERGIAAYGEARPAVVLLDLLMPGTSGLDVCRRLRQRPDARTVPIVMITGQDNREAIEQSFAAGATDFIAKPINWQMLPHRLRFILHAARTLRELEQSEARLRQAQRLAGVGSFEYLTGPGHFFPSPNLPALLGVTADGPVRRRHIRQSMPGGEWAKMEAIAARALAGEGVQTTEAWTHGQRCLRVQVEATEENGERLLRGSVLDVTDLRSAQAQVDWLAWHDPVTGLHNRAGFTAALERVAAARRPGAPSLPLLLVSIERMRRVRETLGQTIADRVLGEVAQRLRAATATLQPPPEAARLNTDELALLFRHASQPEEVAAAAERLLEALARPIDAGGQAFHLQPAGGVALYPQDGVDSETALKAARAALRMSGAEGRSLHFYDADHDRALTRRLRLEEDLRAALPGGQFTLFYQPLVRVADRRPVGVEALLRWCHPAHGMIPPVEFIPLAEEMGLIGEIGEWVLRTACAQAVAWLAEGIVLDEMAVNVSGRQLADPRFAGRLAGILAASGLPPARLVIELTESVLVHDDAAVEQLHGLKRLGVRIALDDFGTGFSSMVSLTRLPLDVVKVDKSFVQAAPTDRSAAAVVEAILALAGRLNMETVAEGVEEAGHLDLLGRFGCGTAQGYLFQKPQPATDVVAHLARIAARDGER